MRLQQCDCGIRALAPFDQEKSWGGHAPRRSGNEALEAAVYITHSHDSEGSDSCVVPLHLRKAKDE
jgi:hypothetical protein